jgi:hypothetical protein
MRRSISSRRRHVPQAIDAVDGAGPESGSRRAYPAVWKRSGRRAAIRAVARRWRYLRRVSRGRRAGSGRSSSSRAYAGSGTVAKHDGTPELVIVNGLGFAICSPPDRGRPGVRPADLCISRQPRLGWYTNGSGTGADALSGSGPARPTKGTDCPCRVETTQTAIGLAPDDTCRCRPGSVCGQRPLDECPQVRGLERLGEEVEDAEVGDRGHDVGCDVAADDHRGDVTGRRNGAQRP